MIRLALRVPAEHADLVLAELLELAPAGVEEVRLTSGGEPLGRARAAAARGAGGRGAGALGAEEGVAEERVTEDRVAGERVVGALGGMVEYAVYGPPGELPELPVLRAAVAGVPIEVRTSEVADDWDERWKQFHRPVLVERARHSLRVRPPWMPTSDGEGVDEIVIDPGQAFGTGAHPTTRMCLELLLGLACDGGDRGPAIDVGAGSGVLAIAAARLGYGPVLALDSEPESVSAITRNALANSVAVHARRFDLMREPLPGPRWPAAVRPSSAAGSHDRPPPVVLANLLRPLLLHLSKSIAHVPAHLIASGLLCDEADDISHAFAERLSLRERERCEQGEWAALLLSRQ